jgi:ADP-ribose pyrophosphatase YjhB (NUDIX family)
MSYISGLRKKIGHQTLIMPCACVFIVDPEGRILCQHRTDDGNWDYLGGSVEIDESLEEACRREMKEESGLEAEELVFFKTYSGRKMHYIYPNGDEVSPLDSVFICRRFHGELRLQAEEEDRLAFFAPAEIPLPMRAITKEIFRDVLTYLGQEVPGQLK